MNVKKATNSQLSTTESKKQTNKQTKTKQRTRTGTESQIWRTFGGLSAGNGKGENGEMVKGLSIIGRNKIYRGKLRIAQEMEKPKNSHA